MHCDETMIRQHLERYYAPISAHPITALCQAAKVSRNLLALFAEAQLGDSNTWLGMLATALGTVTEPKLVQAIKANIECEAGLNGIPHPILAARFAAGLGVTRFRSSQTYWELQSYTMEATATTAVLSEGQLAGWLLAQESLVPRLFQVFRPAFAALVNVDLTYLDEHILVDTDEHARWMLEGVAALLEHYSFIWPEVLYGIDLAGRVTLSVPDILYGMSLRQLKAKAAQFPGH